MYTLFHKKCNILKLFYSEAPVGGSGPFFSSINSLLSSGVAHPGRDTPEWHNLKRLHFIWKGVYKQKSMATPTDRKTDGRHAVDIYIVACQVHPALVKIPSRVTRFCVAVVN